MRFAKNLMVFENLLPTQNSSLLRVYSRAKSLSRARVVVPLKKDLICILYHSTMPIDQKKFERVRVEAESAYKLIGTVYCPYLNSQVYFNSVGFEHLLFKNRGVARSNEEQYVRLKLIPLAVEVLALSHTLQEYKAGELSVTRSINSVQVKEARSVRYYAFVAIINGSLIKVIVRQIEKERMNFYSIIPKWRRQTKNGQKKRITHSGNPEED